MKKLLFIGFLLVIHSTLFAQPSLSKGEKTVPSKEQPVLNKKNDTLNTARANPAIVNTAFVEVPAQNIAAFKPYNNYDFIPGNTILFEDDFYPDQDGEFPAHWKLITGQGVVNKMDSSAVFAFTQSSIVSPLMKVLAYLPNQYTIELDYYIDNHYGGLNQIALLFDDKMQEWTEGKMNLNTDHQAFILHFPGGQLNQNLPQQESDQYYDKWHHLAIAVKENQLKVYVDQYRILTVPNCNYKAGAVGISINGITDNGLIGFKNFRLAAGGGMNLPGKKFTNTKIVTHGIHFDYNKASIRPESMGTINMIVQIMKDNPEIKFEIGGHTDSDGNDTYNLQLSQLRAIAVKNLLVNAGIDASRLTAKGYGESKPIDPNTTPEGKANNRRVEFVK